MNRLFLLLFCMLHALQPVWASFPVSSVNRYNSNGTLSANLVLTTQYEPFFKEWYTTQERPVPNLTTTSSVVKGEKLAVLLFFSGCGDETVACDYMVDYRLFAPDRSAYGSHANIELWPNQLTKTGLVLLSPAHMIIEIEPRDSVGKYTVTAYLHHKNATTGITLSQTFEVKP